MDILNDVKARINIVDLVRNYLPELKKVGRQWKAKCPFHNEKSASFLVSEDKQLAYCFGCHKGGDIFKFYQEIENVDFNQALKDLAERAGVEYRTPSPVEIAKKEVKKSLYTLMDDVTSYYENLLKSEKGKIALDYLKDVRKYDDSLIKLFRLGYSPDSFEDTTNFLISKGYSREEIIRAGIAGQSDTAGSKTYDRFRHRIMIPIRDTQGHIVGFSSRILDTTRQEGKYVNSPETEIYDKGKLFFGMYESKEGIARTKKLLIVEGNLDVITCFQNGITNVCAISGTALTKEQAEILRRKNVELIFALDNDNAGINALHLALERLIESDIFPKVALYEGKDPDESLLKDKELFIKSMDESINWLDGLFKLTQNLESQSEKVSMILGLISKVDNLLLKDDYLSALQKISGRSLVILQNELQNVSKQNHSYTKMKDIKKESLNILEKDLLELLLYDDDLRNKKSLEIKDIIMSLTVNKKLWEVVFSDQKDLTPDQQSFLNTHILFGEEKFSDFSLEKRERFLGDCLTKWKKKQDMDNIKNRMSQASTNEEKSEAMKDLSEFLSSK